MAAVQLIRTLDELPEPFACGALTIGNFDGVHRGHAQLLERLVQQARKNDGPAVVFTFDPHPIALLHPEKAPVALTWTERKAELLAELGADMVIAYRTDRDVLSLTPRDFFTQIIQDRLGARALVEGPNFFFGRNRSGSIDDLCAFCQQAEIPLEVVPPLKVENRFISSSWIRELIQSGDVRRADGLLTHPYRVRGTVVKGAGRGTKLGFPTANIEPVGFVLPPLGVYAGRATIDEKLFAAAINIGPNPTFGENRVKFEVHLLDCQQDLYGRVLEVDFLDRLRDIHPFADVAALRKQLAIDLDNVARLTRS